MASEIQKVRGGAEGKLGLLSRRGLGWARNRGTPQTRWPSFGLPLKRERQEEKSTQSEGKSRWSPAQVLKELFIGLWDTLKPRNRPSNSQMTFMSWRDSCHGEIIYPKGVVIVMVMYPQGRGRRGPFGTRALWDAGRRRRWK